MKTGISGVKQRRTTYGVALVFLSRSLTGNRPDTYRNSDSEAIRVDGDGRGGGQQVLLGFGAVEARENSAGPANGVSCGTALGTEPLVAGPGQARTAR